MVIWVIPTLKLSPQQPASAAVRHAAALTINARGRSCAFWGWSRAPGGWCGVFCGSGVCSRGLSARTPAARRTKYPAPAARNTPVHCLRCVESHPASAHRQLAAATSVSKGCVSCAACSDAGGGVRPAGRVEFFCSCHTIAGRAGRAMLERARPENRAAACPPPAAVSCNTTQALARTGACILDATHVTTWRVAISGSGLQPPAGSKVLAFSAAHLDQQGACWPERQGVELGAARRPHARNPRRRPPSPGDPHANGDLGRAEHLGTWRKSWRQCTQ